MSNDDLYIKTYIAKFEGALLDHVRKQVDSETKVQLYESACKDLQQKLEDAERLLSDTRTAFDQATAGLHAVTLDKDELKKKHEQRELEFELICSELETVKNEKLAALNQVALLSQQIDEYKQKLAAAGTDIDIVKNNYSLVLKNLEEVTSELERARLNKKSKKAIVKDSEWIDGDEISG